MESDAQKIMENGLYDRLQGLLRPAHFQKGDIIQTAGAIANRIYFIHEGLVRVFYYADQREVSCYFAKEDDIVTGIDSFFSRKPSIYTSEAIEDTQAASLTYEELEWAYDNIEGMDRYGRVFITNAYVSLVDRFNSVLFQTAQERYHTFMEEQPDLLHRVPLGYVASYLGMTQETLSRIRAKKLV